MMSLKPKRVAVIGAGPAGLTAAIQLQRGGCEVDLFESTGHVGGMARSFDLWGCKVDVGPHRFFSKDPRINRFWLEWVGEDYRMVNRLTRIYYKGKFYDYPLKAMNALRNMGPIEAMCCLGSYGRQKLKSGSEGEGDTFESWVTHRFGRRLYEMFFKSYSEKLWGIPCTDLDADFAAQRIKKFSLGEAVLKALGLSCQRHATLVDQFAYPTGGCGMPYERMAEAFSALGGLLRLDTPVKRIINEGKVVKGLELANGEIKQYDHVISTMPFTHLVNGLADTPPAVREAAQQLTFRNTIIVYLKVQGENLFPDQWLYVHETRLRTGRITNFSNWVPEIDPVDGQTILALEYWCYDEDEDWKASDESLIQRATQEIQQSSLTNGCTVTDGHVVRIKRCYPVYRSGYKDHLKVIIPYLGQFQGLTPIGRYGSFKYNNQDHSILMGLLCAENLLTGTQRHDLWAVNTDYDYQEEAIISEKGLEVVNPAG